MNALTSRVPVSWSGLVLGLLVGCGDLSLAEKIEQVGGSASVGGANSTGGGSGIGGELESGGHASSGGNSEGHSFSGGSASVGGTPTTSGILGGAPTGGGAPPNGGVAPTGGNASIGGTAPAPTGGTLTTGWATGGTAFAAGGTPVATGGTLSATGGTLSATGGTLSATGGIAPATGGVTFATGGVASAAGGTPVATGGTLSATGGIAPATGGVAFATGGVAPATGGQSSPLSASTGGDTQQGQGGMASGGEAPTGGTSVSSGGSLSTGGTSTQLTLVSGGSTSVPDGGDENWEPCVNGLVTTLAQPRGALDNVFVGCSNGDVYVAFNARSARPNWIRRDTTDGDRLPDIAVNAIACSPTDVNTAYVAFAGSKQGRKLWKTYTSGTYWLELPSVPLSEIWSLSVNPLDPLKVYAFGPGGPTMSTDGGSTWTEDVNPAPMTVPIAEGAKLSTVSVAVDNPDVIWVGATNGDIFYTNDATSGQTWVKATRDMVTRAVTHLALDITRYPVGVFATFDGMYDGLWVTSNNGFGWSPWQQPALPTTPVPLPGVYAFYGVSINPVDNNVLYINGTYGAGYSTTMGNSWSWTDLH